MRSDSVTWSVAVLLSLLIHSMVFMQRGAQMGVEDAPMLQAPHVTRLNFSLPAKEPVPVEPLPVPVKKRRPQPVPEKVVEKVAPEPVKIIEPVRQQASIPLVRGEQVSKSTDGLLQAKRQQYLHDLLSHIESYKYYPRAARRRSIEGDVRISFMLLDDGYYEQLELEGDYAVLVKAAREALESARPLPAPPEDAGMSRQIEFTMVYSFAR